jgi:hypothetical protein
MLPVRSPVSPITCRDRQPGSSIPRMATGGTSIALPSALPAERISSRTRTAAAWLFALPLLTEGVLPDVVKLEVAGLGLLAFWVVGSNRPLPHRALERIFLVAAVLTLVVIGYLAFGHWPSGAGSPRSYDEHAALWVASLVVVAVYAVLFYEPAVFERVIWRGATIALWAGVISCAVARMAGHALLAVNAAHGTLRMAGPLTEPSAWAPVLTLVLLLALRRRSRLYVLLAVAGLVLADSPVCLLVAVVTVPLYYGLAGSWRRRVPLLLAMAVIIPSAVLLVQRADAQAWEASGNTAEAAVGRLLSGLQNVGTDGQQGSNARFASTTAIVGAVRENGWMRFGAGPAADSTWVPASYPVTGPGVGANALWVTILFDFGEAGVLVLAALMLAAAWRVRRNPALAAILLPFLIATLVNSAGADVPFAALAVMLYGLGWNRERSLEVRNDQDVSLRAVSARA